MARLTEREQEVAVAVGHGLSSAEIAGRLHLSVPTVEAHIGRLVHDPGLAWAAPTGRTSLAT